MIPKFISNPDPDYLLTDNYLVLDFETTNLDKGSALNKDNRILLSCWWYKGTTTSMWGSEYELDELIDDIESADLLVAHHTKFELQWLRRADVDISRILPYDTMIGEYVRYSNQKVKLALGEVSKRYGFGGKDNYIDLCMKTICPSQLPRSLLEKRCLKDIKQTRRIFLEQRQHLHDTNKLAVAFTRNIFTPPLAAIESVGMGLDCDRVKEEYGKQVVICNELIQSLDDMTGGINPKSPPQVATFLYSEGGLGFAELTTRSGEPIRGRPSKQFPDGLPKTDVLTVSRLKVTNKRQSEFIKLKSTYTKAKDALSKYLEFFIGVCKERGGVFLGEFNQTVTSTQRLSSSGRKLKFKLFKKEKGPQFQNLPRALKPLFKAKSDEYVFCEPDGSQLEFRVAAHLGRDRVAIQDIVDGVDAHSVTARVLTESGQPTNRQDAKSHTFKPLYGGQFGTKAEMAYYKWFRNRYTGVDQTQMRWAREVLNNKSLITETGLEFYWPNTTMKGKYITNFQAICNYPVQMLATADIIPIAITKLWHELVDKSLKSGIINTIHDSSPMEVYKPEIEVVKPLIIDAYTSYVYFYLAKVYGIDFLTPLGVGIKIGNHWSEGKEEKYQVNPPTRLEGVKYK